MNTDIAVNPVTNNNEQRVLIVDDNLDFAESIQDILESEIYVTTLATSADQAEQFLATFDADVALIDVRLGNTNGIDLLVKLKSLKPSILCVMVTAFSTEDLAVKALRSGAYDFLRKPFNATELISVMQRCFEHIALVKDKASAELSLMKSEQRFRTLVESSPMGIYETDAEGNCIYVNEKWQELAGLNLEAATGDGWIQALHEDDRKSVLEMWKEHAQSEKPWDMEYRFCTPEGKINWLLGRAVVLRDENNKVVGYLGAIIDITEQKNTEKALRRSIKLDAIGQLTGGIAHDFNNILSIILGNLSLLEKNMQLDDKSKKRIESIKHSSRRAADLTRSLLNFSRNEATSEKFTNINIIILKMQSLIDHSVTPQLEIDYQLADELHYCNIDPGDFEDALLNLILNARDAMDGRGKVIVETRNCILDANHCAHYPMLSPGEYVELSVSDNGTGIPHRLQEKVFDPFFTTKEQGKGTGLGLSMVFGFVKRSSGGIDVYSEADIGTTMRLYFPCAIPENKQTKDDGVKTAAIPRGQETVLVVDDEPALLETVKDSLETLGYNVIITGSGMQAIQLLKENLNITLLFSDVVMPEMSGYEIAHQALQLRPELKILLTSGYTKRATLNNNTHQNIKAEILSKPYSITELATQVRRTIDNNT